MLRILEFWKVSDGSIWFYAGFKMFLKPKLYYIRFWKSSKVQELPNRTRVSKPLNFIIELWAPRSTRASNPSVSIIKSMLWEAFRSSSPPELLKHHFSLANGCHFGERVEHEMLIDSEALDSFRSS